MNILQIQDTLKNLSDDQLATQMKNPDGSAPQYLVLGEMKRRKDMRAKASSEPLPQRSMAEEMTSGIGSLPPAGIGGAAMRAGQAPVMYAGGQVRRYQSGGYVGGYNPDAQGLLNERRAMQRYMLSGMILPEDDILRRTLGPRATELIPGGYAPAVTEEEAAIAERKMSDRLRHSKPSEFADRMRDALTRPSGQIGGGGPITDPVNVPVPSAKTIFGSTPIMPEGAAEAGGKAILDKWYDSEAYKDWRRIRDRRLTDSYPAPPGDLPPPDFGEPTDSEAVPEPMPKPSSVVAGSSAPGAPVISGGGITRAPQSTFKFSEIDMPDRPDREALRKQIAEGRGQDYLSAIEKRIAEQRGEIDKSSSTDKALALIQTGLGIAGSKSQTLAGAIAEGGTQGIALYRDAVRQQKAAERDLFRSEADLAVARQRGDLEQQKMAEDAYARALADWRGAQTNRLQVEKAQAELPLKEREVAAGERRAAASERAADRPNAQLEVLMALGDGDPKKGLELYKGSDRLRAIAGLAKVVNDPMADPATIEEAKQLLNQLIQQERGNAGGPIGISDIEAELKRRMGK